MNTKIVCYFLFSCIILPSTSILAADISHVDVTDGDNSNVKCNAGGLKKIPKNLNSGVGGRFIYLCEERKNQRFMLVDLKVTISDKDDKNYCPSDYKRDSIDLNKRAGGNYIYFCRKYSSSSSPIKKIKFVSHPSDAMKAKNKCGPSWTLRPQDLNSGAGGEFIYLCFKK